MSNDYYSENMKPAEPNVNRRKYVFIGLLLTILLPMVAVFVLTDFDRWQGQGRLWWGLTMADETAQAPAENVKVYMQDDEWVVTYQFSGINELGVPERFEHTEEVGNSTVEKIETKEGVLVDYVVGNPRISGLESNHNPFSRLGLLLVIGGSIAFRILGSRSRSSRRAKSMSERIVGEASDIQNPEWMQPMSEQRNREKYQKSGMSRRLTMILLLVVMLMVQISMMGFFLLR